MPGLNRHWLWIALGITLAATLGAGHVDRVMPLSACAGVLLLAGLPSARRYLPVSNRLAGWIPASPGDKVVLLAAGILAGSLAVLTRVHTPDSDSLFSWVREYPDSRGILRGTVGWTLMMPRQPTRNMVLTDVTFQPGSGEPPIRGTACALRCAASDHPLYRGQQIELPVTLSGRISAVNHGVYSYEKWCRDRGIHVAAESRVRPKILNSGEPSLFSYLDRARAWHADTLYRCTPGPLWPWVAALWFGDRRLLDQDALTAFARTGTAHVLAVSGLHVGLLYASVAALLGPLRHRRMIRAAILFVVVMGYAFMAGARGSTMRAALMALVFLVYDVFNREPDSITCLSLAGCLQLLAAPWLVADPGFQMSYACVAALLVFNDTFFPALRWIPRPLGSVLSATLSVQLFLIPLVGWHFGMVSLGGVAANLIAVPMLTIILWMLLPAAVLSPILPAFATLFAHAMALPIWILETSVTLFSRIPGAYLCAGRPPVVSVILWMVGAGCGAIAVHNIHRRSWYAVSAVLCLVLAGLCWPIRHPRPGLEVLDTGHAESILLVSPKGKTVLVDGGNLQGTRNDGRDLVVPTLLARGITRLDAIVVTHPDSDHLGGLFSVVETLRVKRVYVPPPEGFRGELAAQFAALCEKRRIPVFPVAFPDTVPFDGGTLQVRSPARETVQRFSKDNDRSLVLLACWNDRASALLTGDIEDTAELSLVGQAIQATLLKAPHHGSDTSSSLPFLRAVNPKGIVVSTARENRLPALGSRTQQRLESLGVPLWRTDLDGSLMFQAEWSGFQVISARRVSGISLRPPADSGPVSRIP
ncbi:MAG TPA: DNA internalization-related competence protein ComEC/Rec2 [Candidatus Hydrogenedentes bacterium]|nr:DNA internalization-related competence protein ComEC/Rec2 [Candidatus Hydrogenedentota bacterium]